MEKDMFEDWISMPGVQKALKYHCCRYYYYQQKLASMSIRNWRRSIRSSRDAHALSRAWVPIHLHAPRVPELQLLRFPRGDSSGRCVSLPSSHQRSLRLGFLWQSCCRRTGLGLCLPGQRPWHAPWHTACPHLPRSCTHHLGSSWPKQEGAPCHVSHDQGAKFWHPWLRAVSERPKANQQTPIWEQSLCPYQP